MSACLSDDGIWPWVLLRKLFRGPGGPEVLSLYIYLVTNFEVRGWGSFGISGSLVLLLGVSHFLTKELVEGVEVDGVFSGPSR